MNRMLKLVLLSYLVMTACSDPSEELLVPTPGPDDTEQTPINPSVDIKIPESLEVESGTSSSFQVVISVKDGDAVKEWGCKVADSTIASVEKKSNSEVSVTALKTGETVVTVFCEFEGKLFENSLKLTVVDPVSDTGDGIVRVLAIGNSFSQDAVEQYLYELGAAAGKEMIIGNMYIGGCNIDKHLNNMKSDAAAYEYRKISNGNKNNMKSVKLSYALADEDWDYISLQQASGQSGFFSTYSGLGELISLVSQAVPDAELMWHQTWAYSSTSDHVSFPDYDRNQIKMYNAIMDASRKAMSEHPSLKRVVPSGTAIQNARATYAGDIFNRDGYHLETTYGRYTAACTWFEALFGIDVTTNTYTPSTVSDDMGAIARASAHAAVQSPWSITKIAEFQVPDIKNEDLLSPVYVDFGSGTPTPTPWNNVVTITAGGGTSWLKDIKGGYVKANVEVLGGFNTDYKGVSGESNHSSFTVGGVEYPISVWKDAIAVSGEKGKGNAGPGRLRVNNLNPSKKYKFALLGMRYNGSRPARKVSYKLIGASTEAQKEVLTGLKIGSGGFADFGSVPFDEYVAVFDGVQPATDGTVTIEVTGVDTGSAAEGHLNALVITPEL